MIIFLEVLLIVYFLYVVGYTLAFSLAGALWRPETPPDTPESALFHVLIPAYKEDRVIEASVKNILQQDYPADRFRVHVIADQMMPETIAALRKHPIEVVEVSFAQSTKVKALQAALERIPYGASLCMILDADNRMDQQVLSLMNRSWQNGQKAIQGRRIAQNDNSKLAVLDGLSEILNNHIYRAGSNGLGLSSALIGSGMTFETDILRRHLAEMDAVGGFDRDLEVRLVKEGVSVQYLPEAIITDEKVSAQEQFATQRRRWIASQYQYLARHFKAGIRGLLQGNFSLFNSAVLRNIQLPRLINLGLLTLSSLLAVVLGSDFLWVWLTLFSGMGLAMVLAVPIHFYNRQFFQALWALPATFVVMLALLFKLKGANKSFLHTDHGLKEEGKSHQE
ncbi:MAG: glycosyltransferase [Bacteroidota bacterium]